MNKAEAKKLTTFRVHYRVRGVAGSRTMDVTSKDIGGAHTAVREALNKGKSDTVEIRIDKTKVVRENV